MGDGSLRSPLNEPTDAEASPQRSSRTVNSPKKRGRRDGGGDPLLKTVRFDVYMTRDQRRRIGERAKARGLGISPYMVRVALGHALPAVKAPAPPISEVNQDTYFQLAQIGNNLNQLARWANIGAGEDPTAAEVLDTLDALIPIVMRLRLEVIGERVSEQA
jgi:hypothetical protein